MQNQVCLIFSMHVQYAKKLSVAMFWGSSDEEGGKGFFYQDELDLYQTRHYVLLRVLNVKCVS